MHLKKSLIVAIAFCLIGLILWESFWRTQGYYPDVDGTDELWAIARSKVNKASKNDVILTGSSRVHFDIQLDEWEKLTKKRPIQLANGGSSPLPVFHDMVHNTDFSGTILVGVTPGLFFGSIDPDSNPWKRPQSKIDHYYSRTYAQRLNHILSLPLQHNLAFITESDKADGINLKALINRIKIGNRTGKEDTPFYKFSDITEERNVTMTLKTSVDTIFANSIKKFWKSGGTDEPKLQKEATLSYFLNDVKKFKERGGNLILVRCPSTGYYKDREAKYISRVEYWDDLVKEANVKSYHFSDYDLLRNYDCPEWSHLSAKDAKIFTTQLVKILIKDQALTHKKNN